MFFPQIGVYGWSERDENLALASMATGDPLLLIGSHGCAKTYLANKIALALERRFLAYDASKAMFEDVLGYPDIEKLKQGKIEYVESAVTVWDKEFILIDELNRAVPELQSKWLEIIRSRKIMGIPTQVRWVWSAMNPMSYSATQALDEALIGRFSLFLYPPEALQMEEADRTRVLSQINGDDAPALSSWTGNDNGKSGKRRALQETGRRLQAMLERAATHFLRLRDSMPTLPEFLAKFADLLLRETHGEVNLDGRRLGFIYRNILANRAVEIAKAEEADSGRRSGELPDFPESARYALQSSIPVGLNDASLKREEAVHKMEICFDLLSRYFEPDSELASVERVYELFTTRDLMRKAEILLTEDTSALAKSKAWNDLIEGEQDITLLAYVALQIEARRPGIVPKELLASLSAKISPQRLSSCCIPQLQGEAIERLDEIEALFAREDDLEKAIAYNRVAQLADQERITLNDIEKAREAIEADIQAFDRLMRNGGSQ